MYLQHQRRWATTMVRMNMRQVSRWMSLQFFVKDCFVRGYTTQDAFFGMASSHIPTAFSSSASPSTWVIDSGATNHVKGIHSEFQSYTPTTDGKVRIVDGSYTHIAGKRTVHILPNPSLSSVHHDLSFSFYLLSVSALAKNLNCCITFILLIVFFRI